MPCPNTTQSARAKRSRQRSLSEATRFPFCFRTLREVGDSKMATASTPACSRRPTGDDIARPSRPPSNASAQLNATVRYLPPDALRLFASGEARDAFSLTAVARQITASRAPDSAPASQSSSFVALRPSQAGSAADVATRVAPRSRRASPFPTRPHSSRLSNRAEPAGDVFLQMLARFTEQLAAQSAAVSRAALRAVSGDAALLDAAPRNSEQLAPPCTPADLRVALIKSTRLAISSTDIRHVLNFRVLCISCIRALSLMYVLSCI